MLSKTADVVATSLALIKEENVAYGVYRDYFITFYENKHNKVIDISCFLGDSDDNSIGYLNLSDCSKNNIEKYHITDYELSEGMIHLVSGAEISLLRDMLDAIIQILVEIDSGECVSAVQNAEKLSLPAQRKKSSRLTATDFSFATTVHSK